MATQFRSQSQTRRWRKLIGILLIALILCSSTAIYTLVSVIAYDAVSLPPLRRERAVPQGQYENVTFAARGQSYQVHGFLLRGQPDAPALIVVHGYKGSRYDEAEVGRAVDYRALGYAVLSIDLSDNAGDTVGNGRISMGYMERWDVLGAYDYLIGKGFAPDRIGLAGISMGAASVLLAAAAEPRIRAIWADSGYARADTVLAEQAANEGISPLVLPGGMLAGLFTSGDRLWEAAPIAAVPDLVARRQAVYLVHCQNDPVVLVHHGIDLYQAFQSRGGKVTFWKLEEGGHGQAITVAHREYLQRLDAFFKENLAQGSGIL